MIGCYLCARIHLWNYLIGGESRKIILGFSIGCFECPWLGAINKNIHVQESAINKNIHVQVWSSRFWILISGLPPFIPAQCWILNAGNVLVVLIVPRVT